MAYPLPLVVLCITRSALWRWLVTRRAWWPLGHRLAIPGATNLFTAMLTFASSAPTFVTVLWKQPPPPVTTATAPPPPRYESSAASRLMSSSTRLYGDDSSEDNYVEYDEE